MSEPVKPNENITPEMAEELNRINKQNAGHVDESDAPKPGDEPKAPEKESKPSDDKTPPPTKQDDPAPAKEPEKPATPPAKEPEKESKPKEPAKDDDDDVEDEDDKGKDHVDPNKPNRPVKYIPIPKYKADKDAWEKKVAEKDAEIDRLTKDIELSKGQKKDLKEAETAEDLEAFIKEKNLDEDAAEIVRGLATVLEKRTEAKIPKVDLTNLQRAEKEAAERREQEYFSNEFKGLAPLIEKHLGKLTPEQEAKVKAKIDSLAHTKELHQTPLNYILAGNVDELAELIKADPADTTPAPKGRRTAEAGKLGQGKHIQLDNAFFKGKKEFAELDGLDPASRNELISSFDPDTYVNYVNYVGQKDSGVEVNRNGRKIVLK